jgi:hypothetical protein
MHAHMQHRAALVLSEFRSRDDVPVLSNVQQVGCVVSLSVCSIDRANRGTTTLNAEAQAELPSGN